MKLSGFSALAALLRKLGEKGKGGSAAVIYDVPYAVQVHEDLTVTYKFPGQAKYLEAPARYLEPEFRKLFRKNFATGAQKSAELLLAESQLIVPVRTGALKRSGHVVALPS